MKRAFELPTTYEQWYECITVHCGIDLTPEFSEKRIAVLGDAKSKEAKAFSELYGEAHREQVVRWFKRTLQ